MGLLSRQKPKNDKQAHIKTAQELEVVKRRLNRLEPRVSALELEVKLYRREK